MVIFSSFSVAQFYPISMMTLIYNRRHINIEMVSISRFHHLHVASHTNSLPFIQKFILTSSRVRCDTGNTRSLCDWKYAYFFSSKIGTVARVELLTIQQYMQAPSPNFAFAKVSADNKICLDFHGRRVRHTCKPRY